MIWNIICQLPKHNVSTRDQILSLKRAAYIILSLKKENGTDFSKEYPPDGLGHCYLITQFLRYTSPFVLSDIWNKGSSSGMKNANFHKKNQNDGPVVR